MYEPQVDDYVKWTTKLGMVHEGWVYFKCNPTPKKKGFPHTCLLYTSPSPRDVEEMNYLRRESTRKYKQLYYKSQAKLHNVSYDYFLSEFT